MNHNFIFSEPVIFQVFEEIPLSIILLGDNNIVEYINPRASKLLKLPPSSVSNISLEKICPELMTHGNVIIGTTTLTNGPKIDVKLYQPYFFHRHNKKLLFIEDLSHKGSCRTLENIINSIEEAVMACDSEGRMVIYNDANQQLDDLLREQVIGKSVENVYGLTENNSLLHQAMKQRRPILNTQQNYTTYLGKNLSIMCSTYPLFQGDDVVGAVSIMRDYTKIKELSDKILELQESLFKKNEASKTNTTFKSAKFTFGAIVGSSPSLTEAIAWAKRAAQTDSPVLIYGETGTGKELYAQSIHNASPRANNSFIAINCAAIPDNLLEGILFGTVKGSFTGAIDRPGLFEQANGGTLLLDELNSMSIELQAKLLRVLQEGTVRRVGGMHEISVDVRIISNINIEPSLAIANGILRQDLFYRLSVVFLRIPPLHERKEDIPLLIHCFIETFSRKLNRNIKGVSKEVMTIFMEYLWPGNVRQLQHSIESALSIMEQDESFILPKHLPHHIFHSQQQSNTEAKNHLSLSFSDGPLHNTIEEVEKKIIHQALIRNNWNVSSTARHLDIKRQSLQYRMKKHNIVPPMK